MKRSSGLQKKIDFYVGIPIVVLLGSITKFFRKSEPTQNDKIAILCMAALGDLILLSRLISELKSQHPKCKITLFCGPDNVVIAKQIKNIEKFEIINANKPLEAIQKIRKEPFDLLIDSSQWARFPAILCILSRANITRGFKTKKQYRHFGYNQTILHDDQHHEITNFLRLTNNISSKIPDHSLNFDLKSKSPTTSRYVICHLFPSGESSWQKELPIEKWLQIFEFLAHKNIVVYLTGSKADSDRFSKLLPNFKETRFLKSLIGLCSITETANWLQHAELIISVNTGIMHLADSLEKPLIAIHGPTNPLRWGPISKNAHIVKAATPCAPCLNLGFDYACPSNNCMKSIEVSTMIKLLEKLC